jgi:CheY-like chemotaxis protein
MGLGVGLRRRTSYLVCYRCKISAPEFTLEFFFFPAIIIYVTRSPFIKKVIEKPLMPRRIVYVFRLSGVNACGRLKLIPPYMKTKLSHRILIIEDNIDSAESLKMLLEINDHKVEIAADGESGLEKALEFEPQVIVCDIGLPGELDGLEVAKLLRRHEKMQSVYMIALSGYGQAEDISATHQAGFNQHLVKPADFDKLINLVENFKHYER